MMKAIILAGGFGTRLAKITGDKPKPLAEVGGVAILEHQINFLMQHGISDIRLSLHHKANQIIEFCELKWPGKLEYIVEEKPLGTGGGVKFAVKDLKDPFLTVNGDTLSDADLTRLVALGPNTIMCTQVSDARDFGLLKVNNGKVLEFLEKPKEKVAGFINCGLYLLSPAIFQELPDEFMIEKEVFPRLAAEGKLNTYVHDGYWIDVGTEERYKRANEEMGNWKET